MASWRSANELLGYGDELPVDTGPEYFEVVGATGAATVAFEVEPASGSCSCEACQGAAPRQ